MRGSSAIAARSRLCEGSLHTFIRDEEQCRARGRSYYRRPNAIVNPAKAARCPETCGRLKASLESVEREERGVYGGARDAACLESSTEYISTGQREEHTMSERRYGDSMSADCLDSIQLQSVA